MPQASIGIIGGTGLYDIDGFENAHPCGACSGQLAHASLLASAPRHARCLTKK